MRFYNGARDGGVRHHDIALLEEPALAADLKTRVQGLHHIAIEYPTFDIWKRQINYLISCGVKLGRHLERGVSHSIHLDDPNGYQIELVCDLPRRRWENDIEAALNQRPVIHSIAEMRVE
jgi:catechol 2,3-dioxygenase